MNFVRAVTQIDLQRKITQVFLYRLTPAKAGKFTIPSVTMSSGGKTLTSPPLAFEVHDVSELIPIPTGISGHTVLAGLFPAKTTLYPGEQCPLVLKIYAPQRMHLSGWGMPEPIKKNCLAWRFSLPPLHELSQVHINGIAHVAARYSTTLSGISPGPATFGPSKLRLIVRQRIIDPRLGSRITDTPVPLTLPALDFNIRPFPPGAPADFNGAVGRFDIDAQCEKLSLRENESTEVTLRVTGSGNLETLKAPVLSRNTWKIIDTAKITRGTERRDISGTVTFRQIIRPHGTPNNIPAYSFSYFNPDQQSYHTLTTPAIPVSVTPMASNNGSSATSAQNGTADNIDTPPEEMRSILGFIDHPQTSAKPSFPGAIPKSWHIAPALICLLILGIPLTRKIRSARMQSPDHQRKHEAIKKLATATDTRTFYRRAGRFIDQYLTPTQADNPSQQHIQQILADRDALCFQPEGTELDPIEPDSKNAIIKLLKQASKLTLCLLLFFSITSAAEALVRPDADPTSATTTSTATTARDAWKSGQYQQAIDLYRQAYPDPANTPADILYNIGNCHHRLDQPGRAALAWQRALAADPTHRKARKNLRFVEMEQGAQAPVYPRWKLLLTRVPPHLYQLGFYASLWLIAIVTLSLICLKLRPVALTLSIIVLVITPVVATLSGVACHHYPDNHTFAPLEAQAVTLEKTTLYTEAHRQEKDPRTIPAASLLRILATRGPWIHVQTTGGENGWVPSQAIERVRP